MEHAGDTISGALDLSVSGPFSGRALLSQKPGMIAD